jgi:hypothetical protein
MSMVSTNMIHTLMTPTYKVRMSRYTQMHIEIHKFMMHMVINIQHDNHDAQSHDTHNHDAYVHDAYSYDAGIHNIHDAHILHEHISHVAYCHHPCN